MTVEGYDEAWLFALGSTVADGPVVGDETLLEEVLKRHVFYANGAEIQELDANFTFSENVRFRLCNKLTIDGYDNQVWFVVNRLTISSGVVIGDKELLDDLLEEYHLVNANGEESVLIDSATVIEHDYKLSICNMITVERYNNLAWFVLNGSSFASGLVYGDKSVFGDILKVSHLVDNETSDEFSEDLVIDHDVELFLYHLVEWEGKVKGSMLLHDGSKLLSVSDLKRYLDSNKYIVYDSNNLVVNGDTVVVGKMSLKIKERPAAVIINFKAPPDLGSLTQLLTTLSNISGISSDKIMLEVVNDASTNLTSLIVYVKDEEKAKKLSDTVNKLKDDKECILGVLCDVETAHVEGDDSSSSSKKDNSLDSDDSDSEDNSLDIGGRSNVLFSVIAAFVFITVFLGQK